MDTERLEDRGMNIRDRGPLAPFQRLSARIRFAYRHTRAQASTGYRHAKTARPMVAPTSRIDLGRTTEFPATYDDRILPLIAFTQVPNQRREGRVERTLESSMDLVVVNVL